MIKKNYSRNASLLEEEIFDFDTKDERETGINDGRMRLPTRYDISKYYQRLKHTRGKYRAGEHGSWKNKKPEDLLDFSEDFDWQITYSFPKTLRNNITPNGAVYGGSNVTFRRLYLILCEHFNGGEYFIDEYFDSVYPYTIKPEIDEKLEDVKEELINVADYAMDKANALNLEEGLDEIQITKQGTLSKRATKRNERAYQALEDYESFAKEWEADVGIELADMIKEDIISCVTSGQLPCQFANAPSESTMRQRLSAELDPLPWFSATEQLIRSINLYVNIGGNKKWETQSGLLV